MKIKNYLLVLAILVLTAGPTWAQVTHITDDREMFIGMGDASKILPNIMILADNSGSMNTAIYHPAYDAKVNYKIDANGNTLHLIENLANMEDWQAGDPLIRYLHATTTFNICRGVPHFIATWNARGIFDSQYKRNPTRQWKVYKDSFLTSTGALFTPLKNMIIDYNISGGGVGAKTKISDVSDKQDTSGAKRWYWIISVDLTYQGPPAANGDPTGGSYIYINYQQSVDYTDANTAVFNELGASCAGYEQEITNVKLFGTEEGPANNPTRYDENYLYWLAFRAATETDRTKIDQVTYWAASADGLFPDPKTGALVRYGHYRIQVERQVLADVVNEVYKTVNMGMAVFNAGDNPAGGRIDEPMSNMNNAGTKNDFINNKIMKLLADTNTPLAETMADIWRYFKGSNDYVPNNGSNSNCGSATGGGLPTSCPIQYVCQKNYIIVMTDGESTQDKFDNAQYSGSIFTTTSVVGPTGWGDADNHDPRNTVGGTYCPNNSCWGANGTDYLDDMAWFLKHNDMFPDYYADKVTPMYPDMPGDQSIETFAIGFNQDNDMLKETAHNGNGEYYTATSYDSLKSALKDAITNILLRNFGFAAFTAPKKISSIVGEGFSFIGYFLPSASEAIWEGHLQSYKMTDKWCADANGNGKPDGDECFTSFDNQADCETANPGVPCVRSVSLSASSEWDARDHIPDSRNLFTPSSSVNVSTLIRFTDSANLSALHILFQLPADVAPDTTYQTQAQTIVSTLSAKILGDVFHSDIAYTGPPLVGKKYLKNLNPPECGTTANLLKKDDIRCYEHLLADQGATPGVDGSGRLKVIYVGTNDGILHQVNAATGVERWGFIPDEVLPNLKNIVINKQFTYTVDGRLTADDIYYRGGGTDNDYWKTILVFGLKDGGDSFYALDTTNITTAQPSVLWKFKDAEYSGKSWSKPNIGKIRYSDGTTTIDRWVVIVAGGMAFNNEYNGDNKGKAVFVIDASSGELIWMIGYNSGGAAENTATTQIDTLPDSGYTGSGVRYLTAKAEFNYPIPSAITTVDRDSDGYLDTLYFGNVAGHLFKTDIKSSDPSNWKTYQLFKTDITATVHSTVDNVAGTVIRVASVTGFALHKNVFGRTSKAMAIIDAVNNRDLTIEYRPTSGGPTFQLNEQIEVPGCDPIFLSPAIAFDPCYNLWVAFGTGDRLRSRTNPTSGKFAAIRDGSTLVGGSQVQKTDILLSDLVTLTWTGNVINPTNIKVANKWGWQFTFPDSANFEKLFDPEALILPDTNLVPHIYFNTYQPPLASSSEDCNAPKEGMMKFYDLTLNYCGTGMASAMRESGRIAGGGMFQGSDFILYEGTGNVASIPPLQEIKPIKLLYTGGLLFWKEKKR